MSEGTAGHLGVRSSLRELLNHPAFEGFGHLLLPWDVKSGQLRHRMLHLLT